jgi:SNF family Na+-dependent transporter
MPILQFLNALGKLRKATFSFIMLACLFVRMEQLGFQGMARFFFNLVFAAFSKIFRKNSGLIKIFQVQRLLYRNISVAV